MAGRLADTILVAGVDEAGRGPLAGPVVAAAVILDPNAPVAGVADSKKISEKRRKILESQIKEQSVSWAVGIASVDEIDSINILWASMLAMERAVAALSVAPRQVRVDGNRCPRIDLPCEAIVGGDAIDASIGAASILAKEERDRLMHGIHEEYPDYGFDRHKGYPTREHQSRLVALGPCTHHRRSFGPVKALLAEANAE